MDNISFYQPPSRQYGSRPGTPNDNPLPKIVRDATGRFDMSSRGNDRSRTPASSRPGSPAFSSRQNESEASSSLRTPEVIRAGSAAPQKHNRSGSRRGSFREFFRRGSIELGHVKDIIVAPKEDRLAWMEEEKAKLKQEMEAEKEKAATTRRPTQTERRAKLEAEKAARAVERAARAAEAARPAKGGLTPGEDFAVFLSRVVDPLKKKKSRNDSDASLTSFVLPPMDMQGFCKQCKGLSIWKPDTPSPFKNGLCKECWVAQIHLSRGSSVVAGAVEEQELYDPKNKALYNPHHRV